MSKPIIELVKRGEDKVVAVACGECGVVAHDEQRAKECCETPLCECGAERSRCYTVCGGCRDKKRQAHECIGFEKAEKVSWRNYDGPVYYGDDYYGSIDDFVDMVSCDMERDDFPTYVWACTSFGLSLDADRIVNDVLEHGDHHEDAYDHIIDIEKLQASMDEWLGQQTLESWMVRDDKAVLLDGLADEIWKDEP